MPRNSYYLQTLGPLGVAIKKARILLVGAGGIGCELLKNLVLSGFGEIHIVDMDTIDLSNLNRQFLFRYEHIKKPKAIVAKESAAQFNPDVRIEAHHANIKDSKYSVEWFRGFNLVFNALDNLDARRHVNRMCLLANVALIESGTTGFNGQVQTIKKGLTECYDCNPKDTPKTYPVCTIRSTPSQPIHCIVWAKSYLFAEIFGQSEDGVEEMDHTEDAENVEEIKKLNEESKELSRLRQSLGADDFGKLVFEKIFRRDVQRLQAMEDMWKSRSPPEALDFDKLRSEAVKLAVPARTVDQRAWILVESFQVFCDSIESLRKRLQEAQAASPESHLSFDKDDEDMLDFVTAAANLRSHVFGIGSKSKFEVKQMAGNIIPAIATTNAMVAGLCVLEAFKVLRYKTHWSKARQIFLETGPSRAMSSETLRPPNPKCSVCNHVSATVTIDPARATFQNLVEDVLQKQLQYEEGVTVRDENTVLYDPDFEDNLSKTFTELSLGKNSVLIIVDEKDESPRVDLSLLIDAKEIPAEEPPIKMPELPEIARKPAEAAPVENGAADEAESHADASELKRKREDGSEDGTPAKKGKVGESETSNGAGAVEIEDEGPIVLED